MLVRLFYVAKWNKQHSSGYENLLLFFSPDVAVCLHVFTEKLTKSLCWFLCFYTGYEDAVCLSQAAGELWHIYGNSY